MMSLSMLQSVLVWCTILNVGLLWFSFLVLVLAGDWIYRLHSRWFPMPRETFNVVAYSFLGVYKVLIFMFNIVPLVAVWVVL
jgi:hypothetical protein